jgi:hypothetical protein
MCGRREIGELLTARKLLLCKSAGSSRRKWTFASKLVGSPTSD